LISADMGCGLLLQLVLLSTLPHALPLRGCLARMHKSGCQPKSTCTAELVGTFPLVLTVGCNVLSNNPNWGGLSTACSLMVGIYALGGVSAANSNPAVSLSFGVAGKMQDGSRQGAVHPVVQIVAGCCAAVACRLFFRDSFNLGPARGYHWWQAMLYVMMYTFAFCFVVLNNAASKKIGEKNQFYDLDTEFVIVAGAYVSSAVSGKWFSPAVAIAIDILSIHKGFGWCLIYSVCGIAGAPAAVLLFKLVRPEENDESNPPETYSIQSKLEAEMNGMFVLAVTGGMNVLVHSKAIAFSIAASLMVIIYALGDVSGAHFNLAVTVAILCSGREKTNLKEACQYIAAQLVAGIYAAFFYEVVPNGNTFRPEGLKLHLLARLRLPHQSKSATSLAGLTKKMKWPEGRKLQLVFSGVASGGFDGSSPAASSLHPHVGAEGPIRRGARVFAGSSPAASNCKLSKTGADTSNSSSWKPRHIGTIIVLGATLVLAPPLAPPSYLWTPPRSFLGGLSLTSALTGLTSLPLQSTRLFAVAHLHLVLWPFLGNLPSRGFLTREPLAFCL